MFNHFKDKNNIDIHPEKKFHSIIRRECSRSDRLNKSFSLIVFKVGDNAELLSLTKFLYDRIRMSDQIGWFDNKNIGLLLPETSYDGALKLAEEVKTRMEEGVFKFSVCHVYYYPSIEWKFK